MTGWFYALDGQTQGPIPEQQLRDLFSQGRIGPDTLLWAEGMEQWQKASETALFAALFAAVPPQTVPPPAAASPVPSHSREAPAGDFSISPSQSGIDKAGEGLRVDDVLRQSFAIFRSRIGFWLLTGLLSTLVLVPVAVISPSSIVMNIVGLFVQAQVIAMLTYAAFQASCGRDFKLGESFQKGSERFLPIMGIMALIGVVLFLGVLAFTVVGMLLGAGLGNGVAFTLVSVAFVVLATMALLRLFVSIAVCVAEKAGPLVSMRRSLYLTDGSSWKILGLILLAVVPLILLALIGGGIVGAMIGATGGTHSNEIHPAVVVTLALLVLLIIPIQWLFNAFMTILTTTTYAALRRVREGVATNDIAQVFD